MLILKFNWKSILLQVSLSNRRCRIRLWRPQINFSFHPVSIKSQFSSGFSEFSTNRRTKKNKRSNFKQISSDATRAVGRALRFKRFFLTFQSSQRAEEPEDAPQGNVKCVARRSRNKRKRRERQRDAGACFLRASASFFFSLSFLFFIRRSIPRYIFQLIQWTPGFPRRGEKKKKLPVGVRKGWERRDTKEKVVVARLPLMREIHRAKFTERRRRQLENNFSRKRRAHKSA